MVSGERVAEAFDNVAVRVGFGAFVVLPTTVLAMLAIPMGFFLGASGFVFGPLSVAGLAPNALMSLLGLMGAWLRVSKRSGETTARGRSAIRRLLACGVASAAYWAACGVPALGLTKATAVLSWAIACIGAVMIYGTPRPSASGRSARPYQAAAVAGLLVLTYVVFTALYGDVRTLPPHITGAKLEARYGAYLDQAESLAAMGESEERREGDKALRELLERDDAVLWLFSTDSQPVFEYRREEPTSGFGCVGTSDPRQAKVLRCTIHGDLLGDRALRYRRSADPGIDSASIMLDFRIVDELMRTGRGSPQLDR